MNVPANSNSSISGRSSGSSSSASSSPSENATAHGKLISVGQLDQSRFEEQDRATVNKWYDKAFFRNAVSRECYNGIARMAGEEPAKAVDVSAFKCLSPLVCHGHLTRFIVSPEGPGSCLGLHLGQEEPDPKRVVRTHGVLQWQAFLSQRKFG